MSIYSFIMEVKDFYFPSEVKPVFKGEKTVKASIQKTDGGKFALYGPTGYVGAYRRERDAKRGALRRGLTVVS